MLIETIFMLVVAYLVGSISSAILISRLMGLPDPRHVGSKNPGATNVLRSGNKLAAILVLSGDVLKGTLPVYTSYFMGIQPLALGLIAMASCLGHIFPLYHNGKGGKGVATAFGTMLPIGFDLGVSLIAIWLVTAYSSGYASLASVITVSVAPVITYFLKPLYALPVAMLSVLIIVRHQANIKRLLTGTENKFQRSKKSS